MTKRRILLAEGFVAMAAVAGFIVHWLWAAHRITRESAGLIEKGMTQVEVRAILGSPHDSSGQRSEKSTHVVLGGAMQFDLDEFNELNSWIGDEFELYVMFDPLSKVKFIGWSVSGPGHEDGSLLERFRRWLRL